MAKTSSVEKNNKRRKLVDRYAAKRTALKAIVMDQDKPMDERSAPSSSWPRCRATRRRFASATVAR